MSITGRLRGVSETLEETGFDPSAEGGGGIRKARMEGRTCSKLEVYNFVNKVQRKTSSEDGPLLEPVKRWVQQTGEWQKAWQEEAKG